ncbi:MAG: hypothetical protein ACOZFS_01230 [Thermodesulfobacteriota bacterium]
MFDHTLHLDTMVAGDSPQFPIQPLSLEQRNGGFSLQQLLASLQHVLASWHRGPHQGGYQIIIRFNNGYGAIISEYRLLEGIYEIAPLRFHGPEPNDYEFYFRSHVPDLTWCSDPEEMIRVCEQIARLLPLPRA